MSCFEIIKNDIKEWEKRIIKIKMSEDIPATDISKGERSTQVRVVRDKAEKWKPIRIMNTKLKNDKMIYQSLKMSLEMQWPLERKDDDEWEWNDVTVRMWMCKKKIENLYNWKLALTLVNSGTVPLSRLLLTSLFNRYMRFRLPVQLNLCETRIGFHVRVSDSCWIRLRKIGQLAFGCGLVRRRIRVRVRESGMKEGDSL